MPNGGDSSADQQQPRTRVETTPQDAAIASGSRQSPSTTGRANLPRHMPDLLAQLRSNPSSAGQASHDYSRPDPPRYNGHTRHYGYVSHGRVVDLNPQNAPRSRLGRDAITSRTPTDNTARSTEGRIAPNGSSETSGNTFRGQTPVPPQAAPSRSYRERLEALSLEPHPSEHHPGDLYASPLPSVPQGSSSRTYTWSNGRMINILSDGRMTITFRNGRVMKISQNGSRQMLEPGAHDSSGSETDDWDSQSDAEEDSNGLSMLRHKPAELENPKSAVKVEEDNRPVSNSALACDSKDAEDTPGDNDTGSSSKRPKSNSGNAPSRGSSEQGTDQGKKPVGNGGENSDTFDTPNGLSLEGTLTGVTKKQIPCVKSGCSGRNPTISQMLQGAETHCEFWFCNWCCRFFDSKEEKQAQMGTCDAHCIKLACPGYDQGPAKQSGTQRHLRAVKCPTWKQVSVAERWVYLYRLRNPWGPVPAFQYVEGCPALHGKGKERRKRKEPSLPPSNYFDGSQEMLKLTKQIEDLWTELQAAERERDYWENNMVTVQAQSERRLNIVRFLMEERSKSDVQPSRTLIGLLEQDAPQLLYEFQAEKPGQPRPIQDELDEINREQQHSFQEAHLQDATYENGVVDGSLGFADGQEQGIESIWDLLSDETFGLNGLSAQSV